MSRDTDQVPVWKSDASELWESSDHVVVEEPMEIRVNGESLVVAMRTPGDDLDLAAGFLLTDGWIRSIGDVGTLAFCPNEDHPDLKNIVDAHLVDETRPVRTDRSVWANSSCGLCGKATLESIRQNSVPIESRVTVSRDLVSALPERMLRRQVNFGQTGGIHAAGLFDVTGKLLFVREDIGRHNAVDKVVGAALRAETLGDASTMMVSGRLGFEIVQKALVARIPIVASVSAPSSLALELARDFGMTTLGFVRGDSMNIYTHPERIVHRKERKGISTQRRKGA